MGSHYIIGSRLNRDTCYGDSPCGVYILIARSRHLSGGRLPRSVYALHPQYAQARRCGFALRSARKRKQLARRKPFADMRLYGDGGKGAHALPRVAAASFAHLVPRTADAGELVEVARAEVGERHAYAPHRKPHQVVDARGLFFSSSAVPPSPEADVIAALHSPMSSGDMLSAKSISDMPKSMPSRLDADTTQHHR